MSQDEILSLQSTALLSKEKEHHWSCELSKAAAEIQLYKERVSRLEDEVKERREATEELRSKLDVAQHRQEMNNEEVGGVTMPLHYVFMKILGNSSHFVIIAMIFMRVAPWGFGRFLLACEYHCR